MPVEIIEITREHAQEFRDLRLEGLQEHPEAFGEAADDFAAAPIDEIVRRIESRSSDGGFILAARDTETARLVGLCGIAPEKGRKRDHRALLWGMYVPSEHHRRGIGRRLIEHALDRCRQGGKIEIVLLGVATANEPAIALYRSMGFVEYGTDPKAIRVNGRDYDEFLMARYL
jgi:ribosomal protein S18 acetylase RimI-like enzyme